MGILTGLEPARVLHYFEELCSIPHGSGNTKAISDHLVEFAKAHNLRYIQQECNNVIIFKDATPGYENAKTVMLQGHMDMVCAKQPGVEHDFLKDGLKLGVDGDWLHANGTTLGGDDGIAVAYIMALMESTDIPHPALEGVITVDEEIGLLGAHALDCSELKSKYLINLDSESEGIITVSCAGGLSAKISLPISRTEVEGTTAVIRVDGLIGGHSGAEINQERINANIMMGRVLYRLAESVEFTVKSVSGGEANNAIPKFCEVELVLTENQVDEAVTCIENLQKVVSSEYRSSDPDVCIKLTTGEKVSVDAFSYVTTQKLIFLLFNMPNGIVRMSMDIPGLVQTSQNLGVVRTTEEAVTMDISIRSSVESEKFTQFDRVQFITELLGAECVRNEGYPGWAYKPDSELRDICVKVYEEMYGKTPVVEAIHAGLECGLISGKMEDLDCVSMGPDMKDIHTPEEMISISSIQRIWEYLLKILEACK